MCSELNFIYWCNSIKLSYLHFRDEPNSKAHLIAVLLINKNKEIWDNAQSIRQTLFFNVNDPISRKQQIILIITNSVACLFITVKSIIITFMCVFVGIFH